MLFRAFGKRYRAMRAKCWPNIELGDVVVREWLTWPRSFGRTGWRKHDIYIYIYIIYLFIDLFLDLFIYVCVYIYILDMLAVAAHNSTACSAT